MLLFFNTGNISAAKKVIALTKAQQRGNLQQACRDIRAQDPISRWPVYKTLNDTLDKWTNTTEDFEGDSLDFTAAMTINTVTANDTVPKDVETYQGAPVLFWLCDLIFWPGDLYEVQRKARLFFVQELLCNNANPNCTFNGETLLPLMAARGETDLVKALLNAKADPDAILSAKKPACGLIYAANKGFEEIAQLLVNAGAKPDPHWYDWTALQLAAKRNHPGVVRVLLAAGANESLTIAGSGYTAESYARKKNHCKVVKVFEEHHRQLETITE